MFNVSDLNPEKLKLAFPHETIKIDGEPYLTRYYITGKNDRKLGEGRSIFLHQFHSDDQGRELHNHPYAGTSYILKGGYFEERMFGIGVPDSNGEFAAFTPVTRTWYEPGDINEIPLNAFHRTDLGETGEECWTLFITGDRVKNWGFINRDTKEFFAYMDKNEVREGNGPHARDEIDTSIATRRAELAARMSRGEFAVGDSVLARTYGYDGEFAVGTVLDMDDEEIEVGFSDGDRLWRKRSAVKATDQVFVADAEAVAAAQGKTSDDYGCPDRSWLTKLGAADTVPVAAIVFPIERNRPALVGGEVVLVKNVYDNEAYVAKRNGTTAFVQLSDLTGTDQPFVIDASVNTDSYGCPDRSWMKPYQTKTKTAPVAVKEPKFKVGDMVLLNAGINKHMAFLALKDEGFITCRVERVIPTVDGFDYILSTALADYHQTAQESDLSLLDAVEDIEGVESDDEVFKPEFAVGDKVTVNAEYEGGSFQGTVVEVDFEDEDLPYRITGSDNDEYGEWYHQREVSAPKETTINPPLAIEPDTFYKVKASSGYLAGEVVKTAGYVGKYSVHVGNVSGATAYIQLEDLEPTSESFKYTGDTYGCPDRSWLKTAGKVSDVAAPPPPATPSYQVGDKVRFTGASFWQASYKNRLGTVRSVSPGNLQVLLTNGRTVYGAPTQFSNV
jgi:hypothetical protein